MVSKTDTAPNTQLNSHVGSFDKLFGIAYYNAKIVNSTLLVLLPTNMWFSLDSNSN